MARKPAQLKANAKLVEREPTKPAQRNLQGGVFLRKAYKLGKSSMVVALPKAWTRLVGVAEGDWLYIRPRGFWLNVSPRKAGPEEQSSVVVLDDVKRATIAVYGKYVQGDHTIIIENKLGRKELSEVLKQVDRHLLGVQVILEEGNRTTLQVFSAPQPDTFSLLRRLRHVISNLLELYSGALKGEGDMPRAQGLIRSGFKLYFMGLRAAYGSDQIPVSESESPSFKQLLTYTLVFRSISSVFESLDTLGPVGQRKGKSSQWAQGADLFHKSLQTYLNCLDSFVGLGPAIDFGYVSREHLEISSHFRKVCLTAQAVSQGEQESLWVLAQVSISIMGEAESLMATASNSDSIVT